MISTHVYSAFLIGSPDRELSLRGGSITLDDTRGPHVQGGIEIAWPGHWEVVPDDLPTAYGGLVWVRDDAVLDALDPKLTPRVRIEVDGTYPSFSVHRVFDLGVRSRVPDQVSRVVTLELASDEALLGDYAPLADDTTPFTLAASLRDVVDYVLGEAIPGAALNASPAHDADVTPFWRVVNMLRNPAVAGNTNNWTAGGGCTIAYAPVTTSGEVAVTMTAASGSVFAIDTTKYNVSCTPGETYTFSLVHRHTSAAGGSAALVLRFLDANNGVILNVAGSAVSTTTVNERIEVTAVAPPSAVKVAPYWSVNAATGRTFRLDGGMLYAGVFPVAAFTGGDAPSNGYTYAFEGPSNDSASIRTPDIERDPDALVWVAGVSALDFLAPLVQAAGLRLVCDETRTWSLRDENYTAPGSLNLRYGVILIDGSDAIRRDDRVWRDAQVTRYRWVDRATGLQREQVDAYALVTPHTKLVRVDINAPYPGPGRSEYGVRRAQGQGREVNASAVARWTEHAEQPITVTLDGAPIQTGKTSRVTFDLGPGDTRDRVSVTTRTTDTDADAWLLQDPDTAWVDADPLETWLEAAGA